MLYEMTSFVKILDIFASLNIISGMSQLQDAIRGYKRKTGLTTAQLGSLLGVGRTTVVNWEQGRAAPDPKFLLQNANAKNAKSEFCRLVIEALYTLN